MFVPFKQNGLKERPPMRVQDRKLVVLYWKLQEKVHTNPKIRAYLLHLTRILVKRRIRPRMINRVGLEMATRGRI